MRKLSILKTMIIIQVISFLKNFLIFLFDRLYKEWEYIIGNGQGYSKRAFERSDLFATQFVENKYDPYVLDRNAEFSFKKASVLLGKGYITGLSSLHKTNLFSREEGSKLFINLNLGSGPLTYQRQIVLRFGNFERKVAVVMSLSDIKVSVYFNVQKETGRDGFLLNFAVMELNGFKSSVNGFSYFDWAINLFLSFWKMVLGRIVRNLLENELEQYIRNRLPKYQFPIEDSSYRNETVFSNEPEGAQNGEASSEPFCMKKILKRPKRLMSPIGESSVYERNSEEYATSKDIESTTGHTKPFRCFPETNKRTTEIISFYSPAQSLDLYRGSLSKISRNVVLEAKAEELDSINHHYSLSEEMTPNKRLKIGDDCLDFDWNIPGKFNGSNEVGYNSNKSADSVTTSLAKSFENEQSFLDCEKLENIEESKINDSKISRDPDRYKVEIDSIVLNESSGQSKSQKEISSETREYFCKIFDVNPFIEKMKMPAKAVDFESSFSVKSESSQKDENIYNFSLISRDLETYESPKGMKRKPESTNIDSKSQENSPVDLIRLNGSPFHTKSIDSMDLSFLTRLKLNENYNKNSWKETPREKPLHDHEKNYAEYRMELGSVPKGDKYSSSNPTWSFENLYSEKDKCEMRNKFLQNSESNSPLKCSIADKKECVSIGYDGCDCEFISDSDTETSSET